MISFDAMLLQDSPNLSLVTYNHSKEAATVPVSLQCRSIQGQMEQWYLPRTKQNYRSGWCCQV